jgi:hypothetical protein
VSKNQGREKSMESKTALLQQSILHALSDVKTMIFYLNCDIKEF